VEPFFLTRVTSFLKTKRTKNMMGSPGQ